MTLYCAQIENIFGAQGGEICFEIPDEVTIPPEPPLQGETDPGGQIRLPDGTYIDATALTAPFSGVKQIAWQAQPWKVLWMLRTDGTLLSLTYDKDEDVWAPARHPMRNGAVVSIAVIPSANSEQDELWLVVRRMVGGQVKHFHERMTPRITPANAADKARYNFLDCSLSYSGAATDTFSGFDHLPGERLRVWADGADAGEVTVEALPNDGGWGFTLPKAASVVHAGLHTDGTMISLPAARLATDRQTVVKVAVLFQNTLAGKIGRGPEETMEPISFRAVHDQMDASPLLFNGAMEVTIGGAYDDLGLWVIRRDTPGPMTVIAAYPTYDAAPG